MSAPTTNKTKARWQLGVILGFEVLLSAAAIWVGFMTNNWPPVIAVIVCAVMVAVLMIYSSKNAKDNAEEDENAAG